MSDEELEELVRRYRCGTRLKRAILKLTGWDEDDWYREWPALSLRLEAILARER